VQDASGIKRLQWGSLDAYTDPSGVMSPVEQGIRVLDASGHIIFDTVGISQVASSLGQVSFGSSNHTNTAYEVVSGATLSFALARQVDIYVTGDITAKTSGGTGTFANTAIFLDGVREVPGSVNLWDAGVPGYTNAALVAVLYNVGAGAHTIDVRAQVDSGQTLAVYGGDVFVIQLGN